MNGASADPWAKTSREPTSSITTMIGSSHHFLRSFMKAQSSASRLMFPFSELASEVALARRTLRPRNPEASMRRTPNHGVAPEHPHQKTDRSQHDEIRDPHEDGRCNLR